jgi:signal transduction histidine kinase
MGVLGAKLLKNTRELGSSLKLKLIFDLSVLTLCALLLGSASFLLLSRMSFPLSVSDLVEDRLVSLHEEWLQGDGTNPPRFEDLKAEMEKRSSDFSVERIYTRTREPQARWTTTNYFIFLKRPSVFEYRVPVSETETFVYRWSATGVNQFLGDLKVYLLLGALLISFVLVLLSYQLLFKRNIFKPIKELWLTTNAFISENWEARCKVERQDELGQIGETLNEMAKKIQEKEKKLVLTIQSLQQASEEIEATKNEQLQVEKLASVGRLAAGVAHEVGNPLGAIAGYVDILRRALQQMPEASKEDIELCDRIEAETTRISRIIRALLQQARPPQDRIRPTSLLSVVERSVALAQIPTEIQVKIDFEEESAEALCEKDQLIQVLLNLLINAKHAVLEQYKEASGGRIEVRCRLRRLSEQPKLNETGEPEDFNASVIRILKPQRYWVLSVIDNGTGISDENRKKLFEPFFSTKETGQGTGLGLYVAKSIVESFRGTISVQSAKGNGSAFSVFLPKGL